MSVINSVHTTEVSPGVFFICFFSLIFSIYFRVIFCITVVLLNMDIGKSLWVSKTENNVKLRIRQPYWIATIVRLAPFLWHLSLPEEYKCLRRRCHIMFCDNSILWSVLSIMPYISDMEIFPSKEIESIVQKGMKARFLQYKHLCTESTI